MTNNLAVIITGVIFLTVSIGCIFFPHKIQSYVINIYSRGSGLAKFNPFIEFMKGNGYIIALRVIGICAFLVFIFLIYLILKNMV